MWNQQVSIKRVEVVFLNFSTKEKSKGNNLLTKIVVR
jgi:hypothetical protein